MRALFLATLAASASALHTANVGALIHGCAGRVGTVRCAAASPVQSWYDSSVRLITGDTTGVVVPIDNVPQPESTSVPQPEAEPQPDRIAELKQAGEAVVSARTHKESKLKAKGLKAGGEQVVARRTEIAAAAKVRRLKQEGMKIIAQRTEIAAAKKVMLLKKAGAQIITQRMETMAAMKVMRLKQAGEQVIAQRMETMAAMKVMRLKKEGAQVVERRQEMAKMAQAKADAARVAAQVAAPEGFTWGGLY